jgi:hypothetical protein
MEKWLLRVCDRNVARLSIACVTGASLQLATTIDHASQPKCSVVKVVNMETLKLLKLFKIKVGRSSAKAGDFKSGQFQKWAF